MSEEPVILWTVMADLVLEIHHQLHSWSAEICRNPACRTAYEMKLKEKQ